MRTDSFGQAASLSTNRPLSLKITADSLWLGLPVFALICKVFMFRLPVLDFWWHLKMGEVIATTRSIPRVDSFSFTAAGRPFVVQNWLAELIFYGTYTIGGAPLIVFLTAAIALSGFLLMYRLSFDATDRLRIAAFLGFLAVAGNYTFARPQAFSFLLFAAYYFILVRYRERRSDRVWLLPFLMVLWVNLHGAFVLGLGLIALYIGCEGCRRLLDPSRADALSLKEIRKLALVLMLCGAATLFNPEHYKIYEYVRTVIFNTASQQFVTEWQPPRVNQLLGILLFYSPWFIGLFIFIHARRKPDLTETALFFGFGIFAMTAIRNAAWFATVAYPILARYLTEVDLEAIVPPRLRAVSRIFTRTESPRVESPAQSKLNLAIAILAVLVIVARSPWIRGAQDNTALLDAHTPVGAATFIAGRNLTGRIFHPQIFGDYLIWRLWPAQRSFVDGRVHVFDLEFIRQNSILLRDSHWEDLLRRWDIQYMLLSKSPDDEDNPKAIEVARNSPHWRKLYED